MKKNYSSASVSLIASIFMILTIIGSLVSLIMVFLGYLHIIVAIISIILTVCVIVLMYALGNALERIEKLESALLDKKIIKESDLEKEEKTFEDLQTGNIEGVSLCKKCGYQIFEEDTECPNCHTPVKK